MKQPKFYPSIALIFLILISFAFTTSSESKKGTPTVKSLGFGKIKFDGKVYEKDIVIENLKVRKRDKGPSKIRRSEFGHTPLTIEESIPWDCEVLVIGKGMSNRLPITDEVKAMAKEKGVELVILKTPEACEYFNKNYTEGMNAIFHITC